MSQLQSCESNPTCGIAFETLERDIDNSTVCPSIEFCMSKYKPSDADSLLLYDAVTSCYSMDPQCIPSSGSGSGSGSGSPSSGSGSGSGSSGCGGTPSRPVLNYYLFSKVTPFT